MPDVSYSINKGINRPLEFKGLKARYIYYLAVGLGVLLVLFCLLYISGLPAYLDLLLILCLGAGLFVLVTRLSHRYGVHGLMKRLVARRLPRAIRPGSTLVFRGLGL